MYMYIYIGQVAGGNGRHLPPETLPCLRVSPTPQNLYTPKPLHPQISTPKPRTPKPEPYTLHPNPLKQKP